MMLRSPLAEQLVVEKQSLQHNLLVNCLTCWIHSRHRDRSSVLPLK